MAHKQFIYYWLPTWSFMLDTKWDGPAIKDMTLMSYSFSLNGYF